MNYLKLKTNIAAIFHEEEGATAVEYAIMLSLIVGICIVAVQLLSEKTRESFDNSASAIEAAI